MAKREKATSTATGKTITQYDGHEITASEDSIFLHVVPVKRDIIVVSLSTFKGEAGLDIRRFYLDDGKDAWRPTSKGVRLPPASGKALIEYLCLDGPSIVKMLKV